MGALRSFVLYGQGGRLTSFGMDALAAELARLGKVTTHEWREDLSAEVGRCADRVALFGYSLGANQLGWLGARFSRPVELGVAFDPSRQSPLCVRSADGSWTQRAPNYVRLLCFYNPGTWLFGGSTYEGANVQVVRISMPHLSVPLSPGLRRIAVNYANEVARSA